jgi:hypothetical protein
MASLALATPQPLALLVTDELRATEAGSSAPSAASTVMSDLPTARDCAGIHIVHAVCRDPACDRWAELDLAALVAAGQGDVPLIHLPLRCSQCGKTGHRVIMSEHSYGYDRPEGRV